MEAGEGKRASLQGSERQEEASFDTLASTRGKEKRTETGTRRGEGGKGGPGRERK
jgi:hypothetical protein